MSGEGWELRACEMEVTKDKEKRSASMPYLSLTPHV